MRSADSNALNSLSERVSPSWYLCCSLPNTWKLWSTFRSLFQQIAENGNFFQYRHACCTNVLVCRAIIKSSSVCITRMVTALSSAEMTGALRLVVLQIYPNTMKIQPVANALPDDRRVFSDAAGEY